jgi:hypothetical protein
VKRTGRGESNGAVIYTHMGATQEYSLCSCLYLKLAKLHVSCFIFCFFFYKIGGRGRARGLAQVVGGKWLGKGWEDEYGVNNVYTCM